MKNLLYIIAGLLIVIWGIFFLIQNTLNSSFDTFTGRTYHTCQDCPV